MGGRGRSGRGFTLVELLLVLTLVAAAAGLVTPQLLRWIDGARERSTLDGLRTALAALPERAFFAGTAIELGPAAPAEGLLPPLPEGWRVELPAPVRYEANGMTRGGRLEVQAQGRTVARWRIEPPAGRVRDDDDAPPR